MFVEHRAKLSRPVDGGKGSLREHLESVERQTGRRPEELNGPELPEEAEYLFAWWRELDAGRQSGVSANPLSWADMLAWAELTGRRPSPQEVEVLWAIDRAHLSAVLSTSSSGASHV